MIDYKKRMLLAVVYVVLGLALFLCSGFGVIEDFWSGFGGGFVAIGIMQIIRWSRYLKDEELREKFEVESNDERRKFIAGRAWAWTGYVMVIAGGLATIGFRIAKMDLLSSYCGFTVCIMITIYWICYLFLNKKY